MPGYNPGLSNHASAQRPRHWLLWYFGPNSYSRIARRIVDCMDERVVRLEDPRSRGTALTGLLGEFWRYRVGDYRVICTIEDGALRVLVVRIGDRRDVYQ